MVIKQYNCVFGYFSFLAESGLVTLQDPTKNVIVAVVTIEMKLKVYSLSLKYTCRQKTTANVTIKKYLS